MAALQAQLEQESAVNRSLERRMALLEAQGSVAAAPGPGERGAGGGPQLFGGGEDAPALARVAALAGSPPARAASQSVHAALAGGPPLAAEAGAIGGIERPAPPVRRRAAAEGERGFRAEGDEQAPGPVHDQAEMREGGAVVPFRGGDGAGVALVPVLVEQAKAMTSLLGRIGGGRENVLDFLAGGGGGDESSLSKLSGARGPAALEMIKRDLRKTPGKAATVVRRNAREAVMNGPDAGVASCDPRVDSIREFVMRHFQFGKFKTMPYLVLAMATAMDQMKAGMWLEAEDTLALTLCAAEQCALDGGRWNTAWLLTHMPEPPWHLLQSSTTESVRPFAKLPESTWVAATVAYAKDVATMAELRKKTPSGDQP